MSLSKISGFLLLLFISLCFAIPLDLGYGKPLWIISSMLYKINLLLKTECTTLLKQTLIGLEDLALFLVGVSYDDSK